MKQQYVTFLDMLGRTIIGVLSSTTQTHLHVQNPVIVHVVQSPDEPGKMSVQLLPVFFKEFLADKTQDVVWGFVRSTITESAGFNLDPQLESQYDRMFAVAPAPEPENFDKVFNRGETPNEESPKGEDEAVIVSEQ